MLTRAAYVIYATMYKHVANMLVHMKIVHSCLLAFYPYCTIQVRCLSSDGHHAWKSCAQGSKVTSESHDACHVDQSCLGFRCLTTGASGDPGAQKQARSGLTHPHLASSKTTLAAVSGRCGCVSTYLLSELFSDCRVALVTDHIAAACALPRTVTVVQRSSDARGGLVRKWASAPEVQV